MASRPSPHSGVADQVVLAPQWLPDQPPRLLRASVGSASEIPHKDTMSAKSSAQFVSDQYIYHHKKAMENLRESHEHERRAWQIERQELRKRVSELQAKIDQMEHAQDALHRLSDTKDKFGNYTIGSKTITRSSSTPGDFASSASTRHSNVGGTSVGHVGEEHGMRVRASMQSIPEEIEADRAKSVSFAAGQVPDTDIDKALKSFSIAGHIIDKDLDGINLKASGLSPTLKKAVLKSTNIDSPSPVFSPGAQTADSPSMKRPVAIEIEGQVLRLPAGELRRHGAGNTPLARLADSDDTSGADTEVVTPKGTTVSVLGSEKPSLEPRPSNTDTKPIRPPNERSDSYFNISVPPAETVQSEDRPSESHSVAIVDDDPALTGPLSMPNRPPPSHNVRSSQEGSSEFLDRLSEKLTVVEREQKSKSATTSPEERTEDPAGMTDPPLRIRRSMNFGSQLGQGPR